MESDRSHFCGCKGIRTCLKCEEHFNIKIHSPSLSEFQNCYTYCPDCNKAYRGIADDHPEHAEDVIQFPGIYIQREFISVDEEQDLIKALDSIPWDPSQSGRRKQNFGPKCNFKKQRLRVGDFNGFPAATRLVQERFSTVDILRDYQTIEQCSLEYRSEAGSSIDPHIDDCWVWGERIVTVNLLSDSVLTLTPYCGDTGRYNLHLAPEQYRAALPSIAELHVTVRVPMPRRSLLVIWGPARYCWEHRVLREDVDGRRVCLAYREFTPPYLPGGHNEDEASEILLRAQRFY